MLNTQSPQKTGFAGIWFPLKSFSTSRFQIHITHLTTELKELYGAIVALECTQYSCFYYTKDDSKKKKVNLSTMWTALKLQTQTSLE